MKNQDLKDLRQKSIEQLNIELAETRQQLLDLKKKAFLGKIKNYSQISKVKRTIARMQTILAEKILANLEKEIIQKEEKRLEKSPKESSRVKKDESKKIKTTK